LLNLAFNLFLNGFPRSSAWRKSIKTLFATFNLQLVSKARIKIVSNELNDLQTVVDQILNIAKENNVKVSGPVPLPRKVLRVTTQKNPSGQGTITWDRFEMRFYRRLIYLGLNDKALRALTSIKIPQSVIISLDLIS
jgi:small subunit ribosomal protein S10